VAVNCEAVHDLLPAYALGLLDADDLHEVEAHLATCRDHDAELVDLRAASMALDLLREDVPVPASLARRVVGIATGPTRASRGISARPWWLAAAAVVALLAVFAGGWATHAVFDDDPAPALVATSTPAPAASEVRYAYAIHGADGQLVTFAGVEGSDKVTVRMAGFTRLQGDDRYRLWAIRDGQWLRIGQCNTNAQGGWLGDFDFALRSGEELAITIETTTADPQPPAPPILRSRF